MMPIGQFEVDGCHLDGGDNQGVGKVVLQELHGKLELVSCNHFGDNTCCWNNAFGGNGCQ